MRRTDSFEKTLMLGKIEGGGEGDHRGDGWMASPTQWTWVWVNSGSWWWTGRPGVLRFMGSQRVGHDWATELNWTDVKSVSIFQICISMPKSSFHKIGGIHAACVATLRTAFNQCLWRVVIKTPAPLCLNVDNSNMCVLHYFWYFSLGLSYSCPLWSWLKSTSFLYHFPVLHQFVYTSQITFTWIFCSK